MWRAGWLFRRTKEYAVEQIGERLYFVTDGFYTTMFMTTGVGTIVVDAPPSLGDKMLRAIRMSPMNRSDGSYTATATLITLAPLACTRKKLCTLRTKRHWLGWNRQMK